MMGPQDALTSRLIYGEGLGKEKRDAEVGEGRELRIELGPFEYRLVTGQNQRTVTLGLTSTCSEG